MNELRIHTIADLQLHIFHFGMLFLALSLDLSLALALAIASGSGSGSYSIYGDRWVEKLKSSSSMSKFCFITDLIRFMMKKEENLMKGSVHEDDFFIVHDALVLMTAKETIQWMKEKNYYHR